jgi:hypothetical protein
MAVVNAAQATVKTVADPNASFESLKPLWNKCRAVCSGERYVKDFDGTIDTLRFSNLLIPFSPSMDQKQYDFYKAEAELPGIVAQFSKMLVGGLLRKQPVLSLPDNVPSEAQNWIMNEFGKDDSPLASFLDSALWEEVQTSRAWIFVDYPTIKNPETLTRQDIAKYKPYPILVQAESVINWRIATDELGRNILNRVIVRGFKEKYETNEFHPDLIEVVYVHELDESGYYQIRVFERKDIATDVPVVAGQIVKQPGKYKVAFELADTITNIMANDKRLKMIPAWPLNGSIDAIEPMLSPIIDKEISLYNKMSRRNHLLYGASTYTPYIASDMSDDDFDEIVSGGLGTWIRLRQGDTAGVLDTPTAALQDMDRAIGAAIEEMAKMGIRMLTPETAQSGVALEIRNAAQTAQLGTLNNKISNIMRQVIAFMINWRYDLELKPADVEFSLSADFNPIPLGADWLRLATEWYQQGLIPRSVWLDMLKQNDMISPDYNDVEGQQEITADSMINLDRQANLAYAEQIAAQKLNLTDDKDDDNVEVGEQNGR